MRGYEKHAFAPGQGALEVLESLIDNRFADVLVRVLWEETDFGNLTSKGSEYAAQDICAFMPALLREGQLKIAKPHAAQFPVQKIDNPGNRDSGSAGEGTRQGTYKLQENPGQSVFKSVAQWKADGSTGEILLSNPKSFRKYVLYASRSMYFTQV